MRRLLTLGAGRSTVQLGAAGAVISTGAVLAISQVKTGIFLVVARLLLAH